MLAPLYFVCSLSLVKRKVSLSLSLSLRKKISTEHARNRNRFQTQRIRAKDEIDGEINGGEGVNCAVSVSRRFSKSGMFVSRARRAVRWEAFARPADSGSRPLLPGVTTNVRSRQISLKQNGCCWYIRGISFRSMNTTSHFFLYERARLAKRKKRQPRQTNKRPLCFR